MLRDELVVGEVYIRVYNEQPTFVLEVSLLPLSHASPVATPLVHCFYFNPQDAKGFATSLLDFMGSNAQVKFIISEPVLVFI